MPAYSTKPLWAKRGLVAQTPFVLVNATVHPVPEYGTEVSWPQKAAKGATDITEDTIRDVVLPLGLVDVKVCSVTDELWSGLKLMVRKENRPSWGDPRLAP